MGQIRQVAIIALCVASAGAAEPPIEVPDGYSVELIAGPPLVHHPIMAGFDERGRLFVAETAGLNLVRKDLEAQLPGFITMLQDVDGDGTFDQATRFADKLTFPQGALWYEGALYVASSGGVWRFEDRDDDGVAEQRELLVGGFGYIGNAADVHGCFLHPSGRIYFVQGRHGHEVRAADGNLISKSNAGGIFSIRPDGSDFHRHATGGFDNPVELVFTEEGEALGTVNIFEHSPRKDCLVHWVEGGLYPRTDFVKQWDEFVSTGDLLPAALTFGHVAVSGLTRSGFDEQIYVTLFNTHEVRRVDLARTGASFSGTYGKFLVGRHEDFHPTDVLEDADGSLVVIDTGGWFRIGCPTSQIAKPQVRGAIYRVRRSDAPTLDDPRGLRLDWSGARAGQLVRWLDDKRPAVRERAVATLTRRAKPNLPKELVEAVTGHASVRTRRNAIWTLTRIGGPEATATVRAALDDPDPSVRLAAAHAAGVLGDSAATRRLMVMVGSDARAVRREAATTLGILAGAESVPALLKSLQDAGDRFLEHAVIHALIRIGEPGATAAGLRDGHPATRRGALVALDRMASRPLTAQAVIDALGTSDSELRKVALDVLVRRPDWAASAAGVLADWLKRPQWAEEDLRLAHDLAGAFLTDPDVLMVISGALSDSRVSSKIRRMLLELLSDRGPAQPPAELLITLGSLLDAMEGQMLWHTVRATSRLTVTTLDPQLARLSADPVIESRTRVAAVSSMVGRGRGLDSHAFELLVSELAPARPLPNRRDAAQVLGKAALEPEQLAALIGHLRQAGPIELPLLLGAFEQAPAATIGESLILALAESPGLPAVPIARLETLAEKLGPAARAAGAPLIERLRSEAASQQSRLDELERSLTAGDATNGKTIFFSKGTCFACHRVGNEGATIGPDFSTIGAIRARRDLLEAVAFPNASFARGYEPINVSTTDGRIVFGRAVAETQDAIVLADPQGVEHRIPRDQIRSAQASPVSLMPAGLERLLTEQELSDLLEYLGSLK